MKTSFRHGALITMLLLAPTWFTSATEPDPQAAIQRLVDKLEALEPFSIGTDRNGNLWAWSRDEGRLVLFDREGRQERTWELPEAAAVDFDSEWGLVALDSVGNHLILPGAEGTPSIRLYGQALNVSWVDQDRVAVGSALGSHRVVVWNLRLGDVVARIDEDGPVPPGPGARMSRTLQMEVDPENGNFYVLDSFTGELEIFDSRGKSLRKVAIQDRERQKFDDWLEEIDTEARSTGDVQRPGVWRFHLDLAADGSAWMVESCSAPDRAQMLRVPAQGDVERFELATPCCSRRFAIWQDQIVFHQKGHPTREGCYGARRIPK